MINLENKDAYNEKFKQHVATYGIEDAAKIHIGKIENYHKMGCIEAELIKQLFLTDKDMPKIPFIVDVGCGSGRLALYLSEIKNLKYLGTDVVDDLVSYTKTIINRPDWSFKAIDGIEIPIEDDSADIVCFFSVFTHLLHEQTFVYLREAKRVLSTNGKIVFSYLDFSHRPSQQMFLRLVDSFEKRNVLSILFDRPAINFWARELKLEIVKIIPGLTPIIKNKEPLRLKNGETLSGPIKIGQSLCIMRKP